MKPVNAFTALVSVDPLDPLFYALPQPWRVGIAVALFSLLGLYYLFLVIQAFPWLPGRHGKPAANPGDSRQRVKQRKRRVRRKRRSRP